MRICNGIALLLLLAAPGPERREAPSKPAKLRKKPPRKGKPQEQPKSAPAQKEKTAMAMLSG